MYLSISTTHQPATDLGYLLHKHPARVQQFSLNFGQAHVFYPVANDTYAEAVLLVDVDPVKLVRSKGHRSSFVLQQYVNDRPYVASSFLSVAISSVYRTALAGRCESRPELVRTPIPLRAKIAALPCRHGTEFLRELFEPLGYMLQIERHKLDDAFAAWGESRYYTLELQGTVRLSELLSHIYVLAPVLDEEKHYWVGPDEVEKLLRFGEGWLATHPLSERIAHSYLMRRRTLTKVALERLSDDETAARDELDEVQDAEEAQIEKPINLHQQRLAAVLETLTSCNAARVLDLGCGEGKFLKMLLQEKQFTEIVGVDVSAMALAKAERRLKLDRLPERQRERIRLLQGSLLYRDRRLTGYDAAVVIEVIEHLEPDRLATFERVLFEFAQPKTVIVTTPNFEYNTQWETLAAGQLRHRDHRFEWNRTEFQGWSQRVADTYGYTVEIRPLGEPAEEVGSPSQMGVFRRT